MADALGGDVAQWIQAGGVLAFASAVLVQLRDARREFAPIFSDLKSTLTEVKTTLSALLERERARAERIAAMEAQRQIYGDHRAGGVPVDEFAEETGPIMTRTPARGTAYSFPRPRTNPGK